MRRRDNERTHPYRFENVGYARYHPLDIRDNLLMLDEALAISELRQFKEIGGKTLVDMTNDDLGRNPPALVRIAQATGLNILMGSGYYEGAAQDAGKMEKRTEEDIATEIVADIRKGAHGTDDSCWGHWRDWVFLAAEEA